MPMNTDPVLYSVVREEHMIHNDFFLRYIDFRDMTPPSELVFACSSKGRACYEIRYQKEEIEKRLAYSEEELHRYRDSSLQRILGLSHRPEKAFLHEYFSFYSSEPVDELKICAMAEGRVVGEAVVPVQAYENSNSYCFPMKGQLYVSDTYPSINSHRWCRNSEFAMDIGVFDHTLKKPMIGGMGVFAACDGIVEEVFDGLEDTTDDTDLDQVEKMYGEHARIDGNHVLIRHKGGELSLYSHLKKGSITVKPEEPVASGDMIGEAGSSGSSYLPHLHFHLMKDGLEGPGLPIQFSDVKTVMGEPCLLDDTVNLIFVK